MSYREVTDKNCCDAKLYNSTRSVPIILHFAFCILHFSQGFGLFSFETRKTIVEIHQMECLSIVQMVKRYKKGKKGVYILWNVCYYVGVAKVRKIPERETEESELVKMVLRWGEILTGNIKKLFNFLKGVL